MIDKWLRFVSLLFKKAPTGKESVKNDLDVDDATTSGSWFFTPPFYHLPAPSTVICHYREERRERGGSLSRFNSRLKPWIGLSTIDRRRNVFDELAKNSRPDRVSIYEPLYTDRWITLIASSFPLPSRLPFPTRYTRLFSNFVHRGRSIIDSRFLFFLSFFFLSLSPTFLSLRAGWE